MTTLWFNILAMTDILKQRYAISPDLSTQEVDGEIVILDFASEQYFGLDKVGTRIWQLLSESHDLQTVYAQMLQEFDVEQNRLERDLIRLIGELEKAGLIHRI